MATFYVDYENVHYGGTDGIDQLTNMEFVYLFYSQKANTMNMETVRHFMDSRCGVEFIEADNGSANSLDFQLVTFLYTGIVQDDYHYIISRDHGFDAAIKMGNKLGIDNVKRFSTIIDAYKHYERLPKKMEEVKDLETTEEEFDTVLDSTDENVGNEVVEDETMIDGIYDDTKYKKSLAERIKRMVQQSANITLKHEELEISCDAICKCDNKLSLYHFLRKQLGDQRGRCVYTALNEDFLQWKMEMVG